MKAAAGYLGVSVRSLWRLVDAQQLRPVRLPGLRRVAFDGSDEARLLHSDLDACYRALYPGPKPGEATSTTPPVAKALAWPQLPAELSSRQRDEGVLRELDALAAAAGTEDGLADVLPMFTARGDAYLASGQRPDHDETTAALEELWGDQAAARIATAHRELERWLGTLTSASRATVRAYLDETGLRYDVALIEYLDDRAAKRAGGTS